MKKAYTFILIGMVFIYLNLPLVGWLVNIAGYLLIVTGTHLLTQHKQNKGLELSKYLCIGLACFELLQQGFYNLIGNNSTYAYILIIALLLIQFFIFYLIIKAAADETESLDIQTYQQVYLIIAIVGLILYILTCFFSGFLPYSWDYKSLNFVFSVMSSNISEHTSNKKSTSNWLIFYI